MPTSGISFLIEFVDFCIHYAVTNGALFLDVDLNTENSLLADGGEAEGEGEDESECCEDDDGDENHESWYLFDFDVLKTGCVSTFKLRESKLFLSNRKMFGGGVQFRSIKSMLLDKVWMTDQVVQDLIEGCVSLEALELSRIYGVEYMKLRSFTLREMSLKYWDFGKSVEIFAPKLRLLIMCAFKAEEYIFTEVSGLVDARILSFYYEDWSRVVRLLTHVQQLVVQNFWFELLLSERLLFDSFKFPNLKVLYLRTGYSKSEILGLVALLECCPNLETLSLVTLSEWFEEENIPEEFLQRQTHLNISCLKQVSVHYHMGTKEEQLVLALLKEQGVVLEDIILSRADEAKVPRKSIKQPYGYIDIFMPDMEVSLF